MSRVILELACRISSWTTFTPSPFAVSKGANDRLNVCQAMCLVMFARFAAGRSGRVNAASNQYGDRTEIGQRWLGTQKTNPRQRDMASHRAIS
jgi:hypothetical protein